MSIASRKTVRDSSLSLLRVAAIGCTLMVGACSTGSTSVATRSPSYEAGSPVDDVAPQRVFDGPELSIEYAMQTADLVVTGQILEVGSTRWNSADGKPWDVDQDVPVLPMPYRVVKVSVAEVLLDRLEPLDLAAKEPIEVYSYGGDASNRLPAGWHFSNVLLADGQDPLETPLEGSLEPGDEVVLMLDQGIYAEREGFTKPVLRITGRGFGNWRRENSDQPFRSQADGSLLSLEQLSRRLNDVVNAQDIVTEQIGDGPAPTFAPRPESSPSLEITDPEYVASLEDRISMLLSVEVTDDGFAVIRVEPSDPLPGDQGFIARVALNYAGQIPATTGIVSVDGVQMPVAVLGLPESLRGLDAQDVSAGGRLAHIVGGDAHVDLLVITGGSPYESFMVSARGSALVEVPPILKEAGSTD